MSCVCACVVRMVCRLSRLRGNDQSPVVCLFWLLLDFV
uniref:Uncharacterized protein n=1 Tax=Arundo donax TaxID=35708 RepID=A0A0A9Q1J4_ARUDO